MTLRRLAALVLATAMVGCSSGRAASPDVGPPRGDRTRIDDASGLERTAVAAVVDIDTSLATAERQVAELLARARRGGAEGLHCRGDAYDGRPYDLPGRDRSRHAAPPRHAPRRGRLDPRRAGGRHLGGDHPLPRCSWQVDRHHAIEQFLHRRRIPQRERSWLAAQLPTDRQQRPFAACDARRRLDRDREPHGRRGACSLVLGGYGLFGIILEVESAGRFPTNATRPNATSFPSVTSRPRTTRR